MHEMTNTTRGTLKIGAIPTIAPYLLPKVLPSFSRKFPLVDITISEDITPILLEKLRETALDMAIVALPVQRAELMRQEILRERLYLVASSNHALCRGGCALPKDPAGAPRLPLPDGQYFPDTSIFASTTGKI